MRDVPDSRQADRYGFGEHSDRMLAHLGAVVDSSDDAILSKTLDGTIISWNKAAEKLYGYTAAEIVGKPVTILAPRDRLDEVASFLDSIKRGERIDHFETVRVTKDGRHIPVSVTISPVYDSDRNVTGASTIARDITARKRAEQELAIAH